MKSTINKILLPSLVFVTMFILLLFTFNKINNYKLSDKYCQLDDNWTFKKNDETYQNISIASFTIPNGVKKGDILELRTIMPQTIYTDPMLAFRIYLCAFDIYVDDEIIKSSGKDAFYRGKLAGCDYNFINLPADSNGKELVIKMYVTTDNAITSFSTIELDESRNSTRNFISKNLINIFASTFLLTFGIILLFIAIMMVISSSKKFLSMVYVAIFAILAGLWFACNKGYIIFLSNNADFNRIIEYFTLYCFPIPIMLFLASIRNVREKSNSKVNLPLILCIISAALVILTIVLHITGTVYYPDVLIIYHVLFAFDILYCVISCLVQIKKGAGISEKFILFGIFFMGMFFGMEILLFNAARYISPMFKKFEGISALGSIGFIVCMIFSFGLDIYHMMAKNVEREALEKLAYSDQLTKLANRTKYNEVLNEIIGRKNNFTMINFDINDLKLNNDTRGHACGDMLLCAFADVIRDIFAKYGMVCRTGGDEFNVLIENSDRELTDRLMHAYDDRLAAENKKDYPFTISSAWGIAFSDEDEKMSASEVSKLADTRMYDMKKQMKKQKA